MKTLDILYYDFDFASERYTSSHTDKTFWQRVASTVRLWDERSRQRRQLAEFTDEQLYDIGVTYAEAQAEAAKHFWQA
ncbi:MAG: DUF1127 domain-containing protein [Acidiferrobacterales bacterium]